jgi:hypothetical protein
MVGTMIDTSQVPQDKLSDPRFLSLHSQIENVLKDERFVNSVCVHEAAHVIFYEKAGFTNPSFAKTRIVYQESQEDPFTVFMAEVKFNTENVDRESLKGDYEFNMWILAVSKAFCAGGVAAKTIMQAGDVGDAQDHVNFLRFCENVCANSNIPIDRKVLWKCAQDDVRGELEQQPVERKIWKKVREIKPILFGSL